jgi:hypothetical protein
VLKKVSEKAGRRMPMTMERDGTVIAWYLEDEIVCPLCVTEAEKDHSAEDESMSFEEIEGTIDGLWCDRCGGTIVCSSSDSLMPAAHAC